MRPGSYRSPRKRKAGESEDAFKRRVVRLDKKRAKYQRKNAPPKRRSSRPPDLEPLPPAVPPPPPRPLVSPQENAARRRREADDWQRASEARIRALQRHELAHTDAPEPEFDSLVEWRREGRNVTSETRVAQKTPFSADENSFNSSESKTFSPKCSGGSIGGQREEGSKRSSSFSTPLSAPPPLPKCYQENRPHNKRRLSLEDMWIAPAPCAPDQPGQELVTAALAPPAPPPMFHVKHVPPPVTRRDMAEMLLVAGWLTQARVRIPRPAALSLQLLGADRVGIAEALRCSAPDGYDLAAAAAADDPALARFAGRLALALRDMGSQRWSVTELLGAIAQATGPVAIPSAADPDQVRRRFERLVTEELRRGTFALLTDEDGEDDDRRDDSASEG